MKAQHKAEPDGQVLIILLHPDYHRRLRHHTGSADPASSLPAGARGLLQPAAISCCLIPVTAGGELHPALRICLERRGYANDFSGRMRIFTDHQTRILSAWPKMSPRWSPTLVAHAGRPRWWPTLVAHAGRPPSTSVKVALVRFS